MSKKPIIGGGKNSLMNLSASFVISLYRVKSKAEKTGDTHIIQNLKNTYPELFSDDFNSFIEVLKMTATYLDQKYGEDFSSIIESQMKTLH